MSKKRIPFMREAQKRELSQDFFWLFAVISIMSIFISIVHHSIPTFITYIEVTITIILAIIAVYYEEDIPAGIDGAWIIFMSDDYYIGDTLKAYDTIGSDEPQLYEYTIYAKKKFKSGCMYYIVPTTPEKVITHDTR